MRISDWSSDVCSSDLAVRPHVLAYRRLVWLRTTSWACAWAARNDLAAALASTVPATAGTARRLARFVDRSEEHTSELQSLMRISYAVFCLQKKTKTRTIINTYSQNQ